MVEILDIEGYTFDKDVLRLALEEYEKFKATEEYKEGYKWETFEELNSWFERNEINENNVKEFVEFLKEQNPQSGTFVHWSELDDLGDFAEENPEELTTWFDNLYHGEEDLEDRLAYFREKTGIGTPGFGYLLAAYDFEEYAPIKVDQFRDFINHFADQIPSKIGSLSVPEKYTLYHKYCHRMLEFLEKEGIVEDGTTLDAQDFYYTLESYDEVNEESIFLKYLWQFSKRFNSFRSDSNQLLEEIKSLPESFLKERRDFYEGTEKIRRIRYEVLDEWNKGEDSDIEKIKRNVDADYDTDILQAWDNFKIFGQIYVDYFKDRTKRYLESLAEYFIDEVGYEELDYHVVTFQGIQNFVTDEPWIALYPKEKSSHTVSYQLFLHVQPEKLRYGLLPGHDIDPSYNRERDLEVIEPPFEDELLIDKILEKFENALPDFKRMNDVEAEDKTNHYWVNQKKEEEIEKGYLEAPTDDIWQHDLEKLDKGDIVFNYFDGELIGYSKVLSGPKVVDVEGEEKYRVSVEVNEFKSPISVKEVNDYLLKDEVKLEKRYPINKDGGVNQGYLFDLSEKAGEFLIEESSLDKETTEILDEVFLSGEDKDNARSYFQKLLENFEEVEDLESMLSVTYNEPKKKIAVDFGKWQIFSIERKGVNYFAQFAVDSSTLPDKYQEWPEYRKEVFDFKAGEGFNSIRFEWSESLLENRPELEEAWKQSLEFAKDEFVEMRATPYRRHHREGLHEWIMQGLEEEVSEQNYFWVSVNTDIWRVSKIKDGSEVFYTAYNKKGNKRRIFEAFKKAKPGDKILFYEGTPVKKVVAEGEIAKSLYLGEEEGYDEPVQGIDIRYVEPVRGISWSQITSVPELEESAPIRNRAQGSIFELTEKEFETILALESEEPETKVSKKDKLLEKNNAELDFEGIDFTEGLHFPGEMKQEINQSVKAALRSGKNIILTGPPGTGKTKIARNIAVKMADRNEAVDGHTFTTATADWTTFDTMGGYQPSKESSSLSFKPGQFLKCFKDDNGSPVNRWLIIDEINRADIDKAFGQLFSVLSKDDVELPFTNDEEKSISVNSLNEELEEFDYSDSDYYVTRNWRLLATMNTYDKASLYEMSYAFMRRFAFIDVGVPTGDISEELLRDYIDVWDEIEYEDVERYLEDLAGIWEVLNKGKRSIGPAIIRDMLLFLKEIKGDGGLVNALKLYVLPQLEGMVKQDQKDIFSDLVDKIGKREKLATVAKQRFELELKESEK